MVAAGRRFTDGVFEGGTVQRVAHGVELEGILCPCKVPFLGPMLEGPFTCVCFLKCCRLDLVEAFWGCVETGLLCLHSCHALALKGVVNRGPHQEVTDLWVMSGECGEGLIEQESCLMCQCGTWVGHGLQC